MGHEPVLCEKSIEILLAAGSGLYVDATLGAGGHARALLEADPGVKLIGIDRDPQALSKARRNLASFGQRVFFCRATSPSWIVCSPKPAMKMSGECLWT